MDLKSLLDENEREKNYAYAGGDNQEGPMQGSEYTQYSGFATESPQCGRVDDVEVIRELMMILERKLESSSCVVSPANSPNGADNFFTPHTSDPWIC